MLEIKDILCPIDLSEDSGRTVRYAITLTQAYEATLYLCYRPLSSTPEDRDAALHRIEELVELALGSINNPTAINWKPELLAGKDLGEAVVSAANQLEVDLIIMRSRRRPLAAALLGSTAETIVRDSSCAVLVMHADEREWINQNTGEINLKRILVAFDFSRYSELALQYGLKLAQQYQAEIHLIHVLPDPVSEPEIAWVGETENAPYQVAARRLHSSVPPEVHLWSRVVEVIRAGRVYSEILDYSTANELDLICMGAHGSGFTISSLLGSNVDRVLRQATCPVLVVHPQSGTRSKAVRE